MDEPIADTSRSILDGHIMLSRDLAAKNHYPCIDIGHSVSRLFSTINTKEHQTAAGKMREVLARYREAEDLINIGAYQRGSNPKIDEAIEKIDTVNSFLRQATDEKSDFDDAISQLQNIF
jgi:flagellum-specific ATP synthase